MSVGFNKKATSYRTYYTSCKEVYTQKYKEESERLDKLNEELNVLYDTIKDKLDYYFNEFKVDLMKYPEFINKKYNGGSFTNMTNLLFTNKKNDYELNGELFNLKKLGDLLKVISETEKRVSLSQKVLSLSLKEYNEILKKYYLEVHKRMILDGCGYVLPGVCGWLVINRCKILKKRPTIDYAATRKRENQLIAEGKRIYNKEEAEWCKNNGIPYDGVDKRVFQKLDAMYEIVLIGCRIPNSKGYKFITSSWVDTNYRIKSYDQIIEEFKGDCNAIAGMPMNLKMKLQVCLKVNKILYTKFIRNENQIPAFSKSACR